jgi:hypothetical protein
VTPGNATPPDWGNQVCAEAYSISEYRMPIPMLAAHAMPNEVKEASSAAARAGMICSGSVSGSSSVIEAARMPSAPASSAGDEGVDQRDRVRRQAAERGRDLVLRGRPGREPEPGPLVDRGERGRRHDHQAGEDEPVHRDHRAEYVHDVRRQDARLRLLRDAEGEQHRRLQDEQHTERGDHLGQRRGVTHRPVHDELGDRADQGHEQQAEHQAGPGRQGGDLAGIERPVGVSAEHGQAADGEVDDPRPAVAEHDAERDARDERAGTESEQDE